MLYHTSIAADDTKRFEGIDQAFKELMKNAVETPNVVEACTKVRTFNRFCAPFSRNDRLLAYCCCRTAVVRTSRR